MGRRISILLTVGCLALPFRVFGAADVGASTAQFLQLPLSVRAAAMGEAFTGVSDDASAILWNIAGLSRVDDPEIQVLHATRWEGVNDEFLGAAVPLGPDTTLGVGGIYDHLAPFNSTGDPGAETGKYSNLAVELGAARRLGGVLSVGLGGKFLRESLAGDASSGFGLDAGVLAEAPGRLWTVGAVVQNVGHVGSLQGGGGHEPLPTTYRLGLALRPIDRPRTRLLCSADLRYSDYEDTVAGVGAELGVGAVRKSILIRAGYQGNERLQDLGGGTGFSFGAGVRLAALQLDYAFIPYGSLGHTQRFALTYRFLKTQASPLRARPMRVDVASQVSDIKEGSVRAAAFDIKPQARMTVKDWALDITDPNGMVVRRYAGKGVPPRSLVWDGKDDRGQSVEGGVFASYQLRTIDKNGEQSVAEQPVVDLRAEKLDLRGMDPRVLAMAPASLLPAEKRPVPAPTATPTATPLRVPRDLSPEGRHGALRLQPLLFEKGSAALRANDVAYLDEVAKLIRQYPDARVYVEGHADSEVAAQDEVRLSQDRADAVLRVLVMNGRVDSKYLYARGHGSSAPRDVSGTEAAHASNRRVEIVIWTR